MAKVSETIRNWLILKDRRDTLGPRRARLPAEFQCTEPSACAERGTRPTQLAYEKLFNAATEPVLIVDAATESIVEANPAAAIVLSTTRSSLVGTPVTQVFVAASAHALKNSLAATCTQGSSRPVCLEARGGGSMLTAAFSLFRTASESYVLVRLTAPPSGVLENPRGSDRSIVYEAIEDASIGFLMTDSEFRVEYANRAFIEMIELSSLDELRGTSLARWLELSAGDLARLSEQMARREAVTVLTSNLRSEQNRSRDVEVSAVAVPDEENPCWGFTVCERPRLN